MVYTLILEAELTLYNPYMQQRVRTKDEHQLRSWLKATDIYTF